MPPPPPPPLPPLATPARLHPVASLDPAMLALTAVWPLPVLVPSRLPASHTAAPQAPMPRRSPLLRADNTRAPPHLLSLRRVPLYTRHLSTTACTTPRSSCPWTRTPSPLRPALSSRHLADYIFTTWPMTLISRFKTAPARSVFAAACGAVCLVAQWPCDEQIRRGSFRPMSNSHTCRSRNKHGVFFSDFFFLFFSEL